MASRINTPKTASHFVGDMSHTTRVHCASDVADDCFGTLIHHAAVVFVVAVAVA